MDPDMPVGDSTRALAKMSLGCRLESHNPITRRNRVDPRFRDLFFGIVRTGAKVGELLQYEGNALGLQHRIAICDLQMEVCARRIATVAKEGEHVSEVNMGA